MSNLKDKSYNIYTHLEDSGDSIEDSGRNSKYSGDGELFPAMLKTFFGLIATATAAVNGGTHNLNNLFVGRWFWGDGRGFWWCTNLERKYTHFPVTSSNQVAATSISSGDKGSDGVGSKNKTSSL